MLIGNDEVSFWEKICQCIWSYIEDILKSYNIFQNINQSKIIMMYSYKQIKRILRLDVFLLIIENFFCTHN